MPEERIVRTILARIRASPSHVSADTAVGEIGIRSGLTARFANVESASDITMKRVPAAGHGSAPHTTMHPIMPKPQIW